MENNNSSPSKRNRSESSMNSNTNLNDMNGLRFKFRHLIPAVENLPPDHALVVAPMDMPEPARGVKKTDETAFVGLEKKESPELNVKKTADHAPTTTTSSVTPMDVDAGTKIGEQENLSANFKEMESVGARRSSKALSLQKMETNDSPLSKSSQSEPSSSSNALEGNTSLSGTNGLLFGFRHLIPVVEKLSPDHPLIASSMGITVCANEVRKSEGKAAVALEEKESSDLNVKKIADLALAAAASAVTPMDVEMAADSDIVPADFKEMEAVETQLMEENLFKEAVNRKTVSLKPVDKKDTFKLLQILLDRSSIYAELILKRMKDEEENQRMKEEKEAKARAEAKVTAAVQPAEEVTLVNRRRTHRSTKQSSQAKYADFFDPDMLQAKRSKCKREELRDLKTVKPSENRASASTMAENGSNVGDAPTRQPALLTGGTLRSYQVEGFEWLKAQYVFGINGILGDEMGLGKTIQCIALICYLYEQGIEGPYLITAPLSTIPNWIMEFERFAPQVPVILYHGHYKHREAIRNEIKKKHIAPWNGKRILPVVVTSYEMIINDRLYLSKFQWKYLIVDEAQRIKNFRCRLLQKLKCYSFGGRLLLTGTPVQNNLEELWSLLNFLLPDVFEDLEWFETLFGIETVHQGSLNAGAIVNLAKQEEENQMLSKMHRILAPFLLRRLKSDVELELPKKKEVLVYAPMTRTQMEIYKAGIEKTIMGMYRPEKSDEWKPLPDDVRLRSENQKSLSTEKSRSSVIQNLKCVRRPITMFQKIMMHPYLLENPLVPGTTDKFLIDENLVRQSGKMLVLDRLLVALKERGHKVLLFSTMTQMLDILMDYCQLRRFDFCRLDGRLALDERQVEINHFNKDPECFLFLISTRAGGLGLNLVGADTVVLFDSDWNPQVDLQAQDRCHRIGQTKPVIIYRLVAKGTIDERILERATAKRRLEKMIIHSGKFKRMTEPMDNDKPMTKAELEELLKSTDYNDCWEWKSTGKEVISDEELERLLDRSG